MNLQESKSEKSYDHSRYHILLHNVLHKIDTKIFAIYNFILLLSITITPSYSISDKTFLEEKLYILVPLMA